MNKSNIKFLALLSALMSCTPALGAMKNGELDNLQTNMVKSDHLIKKPLGSYQQIEKIDTFGTSELDLEAFILMLNDSHHFGHDFVEDDDNFKDNIEYDFNVACEGSILVGDNQYDHANYKLMWKLPLEFEKLRKWDGSTLEFDVKHKKDGKIYTIVGKSLANRFVDGVPLAYEMLFYIKNQNNVTNEKFREMLGQKIQSDNEVDSVHNEIREINMLSALKFLMNGCGVQRMRRILESKHGYYLKLCSWGRCSENSPYLCRRVSNTEEPNVGEFQVKLLDNRGYGYVCELYQTTDGFYEFQIVQKILPEKEEELWESLEQ